MADTYAVPADETAASIAANSGDEQSELDSNVAVYDDKVEWINCVAYEDFENPTDDCNVEEATASEAVDNVVSAVNLFRDLIQRNVPLHPMQRFDTSDEVSDDADCPTQSTLVIERLEDAHEATRDNFDDYLMEVIAVEFVNTCPFRRPTMCGICMTGSGHLEAFVTYMDLVEHTRQCHEAADGEWQCCLCDSARVAQPTFEDQRAWTIHMCLVHSDLLEANLTLKCPTCTSVFESAVQFGKHICELDSLPSADTTSCTECAATFATNRRLKFHMLHRHPQTSTGDSAVTHMRQCVCLACGRTYADDQLFYEHVSFEHESYALFVCAVCDQCFTNGVECERHQRAHSAVRRYTCAECDARFVKRTHLNTHRHIHNSDRLHCDHCPKSFKRATLLRQHIHRMHIQFEPQQLPHCSACGEVFTNADSTAQWREHLPCNSSSKAVDPEPRSIGEFTELLCCEFCERAFGQAVQLASHRQQCPSRQHRHNATEHRTSDESDIGDGNADHTDNDRRSQFTCPLCHKTFDTFGKRMNHWRSHRGHPDLPSASAVRRCYVCDVAECGRRFVDWPTMQQHRKSGHLIGPTVMRCTECDAVFYQSWRLAHHRRVHHAERLRCPLCPASFVQRSSLNAHTLRVHMNERPIAEVRVYRNRVLEEYFRVVPRDGSFTCRQCDKNVAHRRNAIAHAEAVHMRLRDFNCAHCEATFFGQNDLRKHMRRRHGTNPALVTERGEPMECAYCGHRERSKVQLTAHMLREHCLKK